MKTTLPLPLRSAPNAAKQVCLALFLAVAVMFPYHAGAATIPGPVNLGTAGDFAVLAGSGITVTGPTTITGDIGTYPTPSITGIINVTLNGANRTSDSGGMITAKDNLSTAYIDAAGRPYDATYAGGFDLGNLTLPSGVYNDGSSFFLTGSLTLDAQGDPNAVWIFQAGSTLITASDSVVSLINGAQACNVFWQVGSSATLGTGTDFVGNIMALESITLNTGATVDGRVLARNAAVTLDNNTIARQICAANGGGSTVPDAGGTLLLLSSGLASLLAFRRWFCLAA